ncbi:MAG: hypothetical protein HFI37_01030 [Lachnospiraceae bacterium]|nr:hypothetical protein [Lachnospiraceae bacterium]
MIYGKMLLICAVVFVVLELLGMLYTCWQEEENSIALNFVAGLFLAFAIFEILVIPCIFSYQKFHIFAGLYGSLLVLLCSCSLILNRKRLKEFFGKSREQERKKLPIVFIIVLLFVVFEMLMYVKFAHIDDDDAFYVATAVTTLEEDSMFVINPYSGDVYHSFPTRYVLSPFPVWNAFVSKVFRIHPTIFAHTVLPVIMITAAFFVYYLIGMRLFQQDLKKTGYFLLFCTMIQMFSAYTRHPQGMVYLVRIWQGKAILASVLLPACFYLAMRLFLEKARLRDWLFCLILMLSCCMVSSMGIILGAISMGLFGIWGAVSKRRVREAIFTALCCTPNAALAIVYLLM